MTQNTIYIIHILSKLTRAEIHPKSSGFISTLGVTADPWIWLFLLVVDNFYSYRFWNWKSISYLDFGYYNNNISGLEFITIISTLFQLHSIKRVMLANIHGESSVSSCGCPLEFFIVLTISSFPIILLGVGYNCDPLGFINVFCLCRVQRQTLITVLLQIQSFRVNIEFLCNNLTLHYIIILSIVFDVVVFFCRQNPSLVVTWSNI